MLGEMFAAIATVVILAVGIVTQPRSARCPSGWNLQEGVRRDGAFSCWAPLPRCCGDAKGVCELVRCPQVPIIRGRIHCTNGQIPVQADDGRTVGCQARH